MTDNEYVQGRTAFYNGWTLDDNPYITVGWTDWAFGWTEAQSEAKDKKMTERKYNKGDKVTVEGTVIGGNLNFDLLIEINGAHVYYPENEILSHTPAPIKVGDKVRILPSGESTYEVLAVLKDRYVWLSNRATGEPFTTDIRNVKRV